MTVFETLRMHGYRGFEDYTLDGLRRVNLIVGRNNCGKTSVIEAVNLLVSGPDPWFLESIARERGEAGFVGEGEEREFHWSFRHFFRGHQFDVGAEFAIESGPGGGKFVCSVREPTEEDMDDRQQRLFNDTRSQPLMLTLHHSDAHTRETNTLSVPVSEDGTSLLSGPDRYFRLRRLMREEKWSSPPVISVGTASLSSNSMRQMWSDVMVEAREQDVIRALQILEPNLENVLFLPIDRQSRERAGDTSGILVQISDSSGRQPLGSHGEGMSRLLALSVCLVETAGGYLLEDEIDTGLHYSIMQDMWKLVTKTAVDTDIQVFATTHSLDCVRGLGLLCREHPELGEYVSLQKIDPRLDTAVAFHREEIIHVEDTGLEVR